MRDSENIMEAMKLPIDLMGFIFYEKSPRYVTQTSRLLRKKNILRVGVFVTIGLHSITW